jgi:tetratricopeptide (TPR) repeat protein
VACFEYALEALKHLPKSRDLQEQTIDLRLDLRNALFPLDEHEQIMAHLREAESLGEALNDHQRLGQIYTYMAAYFRLTGDVEDGVTYGRKALASAKSLGDVRLQVMANYRLGQIYTFLGDYPQAIACLRDNVAALEGDLRYERFGMVGLPSVFSRTYLVACLSECGEFDEGMRHGEESIRIAETVDHPFSIVHGSGVVGEVNSRRGNFRQAISLFERNLELCRVWGFSVLYPFSAAYLGYAYAMSGQVARALSLLEDVLERTAWMRGGPSTRWLIQLGEVYLLTGRMTDARTWAERALQVSREYDERGHQAYTLRSLGDIAMHHDPSDIDQAETLYQQALALANELGMRPLQAHCHRGLGNLYRQTGQSEQARAELSTAIEMYRDMEMTFWLPETEAALAEVESR